MISDRRKTGLQAAKRQGIKLGPARPSHWNGRENARKAGAVKESKVADGVATTGVLGFCPCWFCFLFFLVMVKPSVNLPTY